MADVLNRTTLEFRKSVHTPDYSWQEWIINPDFSAVEKVPRKYWTVDGDKVRAMTAEEKVVVDAAALVQYKAAKLDSLRETSMQQVGAATGKYKAAKAKVDAAEDKAAVDAVTLEEEGV